MNGDTNDPFINKRCFVYGQPGRVKATKFTNDGWKVTRVTLDNGARIDYPALKDIKIQVVTAEDVDSAYWRGYSDGIKEGRQREQDDIEAVKREMKAKISELMKGI